MFVCDPLCAAERRRLQPIRSEIHRKNELPALVRNRRSDLDAVTKGTHLCLREDVSFPVKYRSHDSRWAGACGGEPNLRTRHAGSTGDARADLGGDELTVVEARRVHSDGLLPLPLCDPAG